MRKISISASSRWIEDLRMDHLSLSIQRYVKCATHVVKDWERKDVDKKCVDNWRARKTTVKILLLNEIAVKKKLSSLARTDKRPFALRVVNLKDMRIVNSRLGSGANEQDLTIGNRFLRQRVSVVRTRNIAPGRFGKKFNDQEKNRINNSTDHRLPPPLPCEKQRRSLPQTTQIVLTKEEQSRIYNNRVRLIWKSFKKRMIKKVKKI